MTAIEEVKRLQEDRVQLCNEIDKLQVERDTLRRQLELVQQEQREMEKDLDEYRGHIETLENSIRDMKGFIETAREKTVNATKVLEVLHNLINEGRREGNPRMDAASIILARMITDLEDVYSIPHDD